MVSQLDLTPSKQNLSDSNSVELCRKSCPGLSGLVLHHCGVQIVVSFAHLSNCVCVRWLMQVAVLKSVPKFSWSETVAVFVQMRVRFTCVCWKCAVEKWENISRKESRLLKYLPIISKSLLETRANDSIHCKTSWLAFDIVSGRDSKRSLQL